MVVVLKVIVNRSFERFEMKYIYKSVASDNDQSDHVHYCKECTHWYLCKRTELRCEFISNSMISHRKHIESMDIEDDRIKHF